MAVKDPLKGIGKVITDLEKGKTGVKTVDMQKRKDAALTKNLKRMAKRTKVRARPQTLDITPDSKSPFSIQKQTIMMAGGGEVINMTKMKQLKLLKTGGSVDALKGIGKMITDLEKGKTGIKTVDMQKRKDAALTKNLKRMAKRTKVRAKPQTLDITPKPGGAFSIQQRSIMMASEGGVVDMTKSRMINPETGE